ncbi:hypothetical protein [Sinorhizobium meliloti]|nr:hypothetical protein [Sinorhizobium meliloti]
MTTYEHIEELRAELAASIDAGERQQIAAELEPSRSTSRKRPHSTR